MAHFGHSDKPVAPDNNDGTAPLSRTLEQLTLASRDVANDKAPPSTPSLRRGSTPTSKLAPINTRRPSIPAPNSPRQTSATPSTSPNLFRKGSTSSLRSVTAPTSPRIGTPRRVSSGLPLRSPSQLSFQLPDVEPKEPTKPLTAATIASDFFAKELAAHSGPATQAETVVIVHDACYGHRFSRLRTSKSALSMIVERPERIRASVLGMSAAYVRLGSRHSGGSCAPTPDREPEERPPFAIRKSAREVSLLSSAVVAVHGREWMDELQTMCAAAGLKLALGEKELERPKPIEGQDARAEKASFHEGDLYLCQESLDAFQGALGGVYDGIDAIFSSSSLSRRAFVAIRPPGHHCSADFPSGFCWLNNVHVGIEYAAQTYGLTHAAILDFDLHHGDGSQDITWARNEKSAAMPKNTPYNKKVSIGYYSMHDINSYPCEYGDREKVQNASLCIDNAHGQSIWNVHLEPWKTIDEFWKLYEHKYSILLQKTRSFLRAHTARIRATPKAVPAKSAIFISAGFDASEWEGAGMQRHAVNVPTEFYARFTSDVVQIAQDEGTAAEGRVISVLEGGYSDRALTSGVLSHLSGLCQPATQSPGASSIDSNIPAQAERIGQTVSQYDTQWWHSDLLYALENYLTPPEPAPVKKGRNWAPTFATPTASFSQKVVDMEKFSRTISGTLRPVEEIKVDPASLRVNWILATHELSKLIIPTDRTTTSCKPEDLAVPRTKKQRQSADAPVVTEHANGGRQLRDRKTKLPEHTNLTSDDDLAAIKTATSEADRRKTIGVVTGAEQGLPVAPRRSSRRSSMASDLEVLAPDTSMAPPVPALPTQTLPEPKAKAPPRSPRAKKTKVPVSKPSAAAHTIPAPAILPPKPTFNEQVFAKPATEPTIKQETTASETSSSQDLDRLASGIKKITLKVGTREEHDRKQRERLEAEKAEKEAKKKPRKIAVSKLSGRAVQSPKPDVQTRIGSSTPTIKTEPDATGGDNVQQVNEKFEPSVTTAGPVSEIGGSSGFLSSTAENEVQGGPPYGGSTGADATITEAADVATPQQELREHKPANAMSLQNILTPAAQAPNVPSQAALYQPPAQAPQDPATPVSRPVDSGPSAPDTAARQLPSEHQAAQFRPSQFRSFAPQEQQQQQVTFGNPSLPSAQGNRSSNNLPSFSSTGTIPFAPAAARAAEPASSSAAAATQPMRVPLPALGPEIAQWNGNGVSISMLAAGDRSADVTPEPKPEGEREIGAGLDIWEVPETPARR